MWAMEYNPNIFSLYEEPRDAAENIVAPKINEKLLKQYGKFERKNVKTGRTDQHSALAVFLVASVLETKNKRLLKEAKGLDDVVKVSLSHMCLLMHIFAFMLLHFSYGEPFSLDHE